MSERHRDAGHIPEDVDVPVVCADGQRLLLCKQFLHLHAHIRARVEFVILFVFCVDSAASLHHVGLAIIAQLPHARCCNALHLLPKRSLATKPTTRKSLLSYTGSD